MSVRSLLVSATLILSCLSAGAQHIVKGKVADSATKDPEPGAVAQVFAGEAKPENLAGYSLCDTLGNFTIKLRKVVDAEYRLKVINMGRMPVERSFVPKGESTDFGTIYVEDDVQALESAKVAAARPLIKMEADKISYDVANDSDSKASTVLDMLRKVPMVTVDAQDNITVNGSSSFAVYVDGKPNPMLSSNPSQIFKAMPASAVKGIEVITNPGAKYDAEGTGGVLNLIIARTETGASAIPDGASGNIYLGADTKKGINGGLYTNARKGKFSVGLNGFTGTQKMWNLEQHSVQEMKSANLKVKNDADGLDQDANFTFGNVTLSYEADTLNLISASAALRRIAYEQKGPWNISSTMGDAPLYSYEGNLSTRNKSAGVNASIDWQHSSKANKERMTTLSYRFSSDPTNSYFETGYKNYTGITPASAPSRKVSTKSCSMEHTFQGDFTTPLAPGHTLSTGVKYIFRDNHATNKNYNDIGSGYTLEDTDNDNYRHYNHIGAAYLEYAASLGMFSLKSGIRYEHTWLDVRFEDGTSYNNHYDNVVPDVSLQYNLGMTSNIGLTYNMRIHRPGISYLNPFIDRGYGTQIQYGNSDIRPETNHNFALKYNFFSPKFMVSAGASYRFGKGGIEQYQFYGPDPEYPAQDILQITYGNISDSHMYGINYFVNWNPFKDTRIYSSGELEYSVYSSDVLNQKNSGWCPQIMVGGQQTLPWDIRLGANLFWSGRRYTLQGWTTGFSGASLSLSRNFFNEKFGVSLQGFTNFGCGPLKMQIHNEGNGFVNDTKVSIPLKTLQLQLTYNFGKNNIQVKKTQRSITNDDVINAEKSGTAAGGAASSMDPSSQR